MVKMACRLLVAAVVVCANHTASAQEKVDNWEAPAFWSAPVEPAPSGETSTMAGEAIEAVPTPPVPFVGLAPCRLVDTRGNGFTGAYGPPALVAGSPRNFVLTGRCGISATAQAVSLNVTVTNTQGPGHIVIYPAGGAQPTVSTLNYVAGQTIANAAVVPLGTGGAITVVAGVSGTDLILDTNGDYRGGVVTSVNGLSGGVTLSSASPTLLSVTPQGQNVVLDVEPDNFLPPGGSNQTLRSNGTSWVAADNLLNNGLWVDVTGELRLQSALVLPSSNVIVNSGSTRFLHNPGVGNTLLGRGTSTAGTNNTSVGEASLGAFTFGGVSSGNDNVAVGWHSLNHLQSGSGNIGIGSNVGTGLTTGSNNIAIGTSVGTGLSTGNNNIYIGNPGSGDESGQIRIGTVANITQGTVIVGISGFQSVGGIPVIVNGGGRLGTTTSSIRFKEDVHTLGPESDDLMKLRPVAFRYKEGALQEYGLIAEEVAEVYPDLVVNDDQGRPLAIRSQLLDPLLLNEIQKQRREIEELKARLSELERKKLP